VIRAFEERDRVDVERLMSDFGDELAAMDPAGRVLRREGFGAFFVSEMLRERDEREGAVLLAEVGNRIVGFAAGGVRLPDEGDGYSVEPFRNGRVTELYVAPDARRAGIGRALAEAMEQHFATVGCTATRIEVWVPNECARTFYERIGYEEAGIDLRKELR